MLQISNTFFNKEFLVCLPTRALLLWGIYHVINCCTRPIKNIQTNCEMEIPESFEVRLHDLSHRVFTFGDANKIQEFSMHWMGAMTQIIRRHTT